MRNNLLPFLLLVLTIALFAWAFFSRSYVLAGLSFDVLGVVFLAWEELKTATASIRLQTRMSPGDVTMFWNHVDTLPWYRRFPVKLAAKCGPKDIMAGSQEFTDESFPRKAWGMVFLVIGFILQGVGFLIGSNN